jgi:hypothetical protein
MPAALQRGLYMRASFLFHEGEEVVAKGACLGIYGERSEVRI